MTPIKTITAWEIESGMYIKTLGGLTGYVDMVIRDAEHATILVMLAGGVSSTLGASLAVFQLK